MINPQQPPRDPITFFAAGKPAAQGSKRLARINGRTVMIESSRHLHTWRSGIAHSAHAAGVRVNHDDIELTIKVVWPRPTSHFKRDRCLRDNLPPRPRYLDADKICRSVCDALTGIAYIDDRQVSNLSIERCWCSDDETLGAWVTVRPAESEGKWVFTTNQ